MGLQRRTRVPVREPGEDVGQADARSRTRNPATLCDEHRRQVTFVLEVVELLAQRYRFDPAALVSPRTGIPLGPALARMRAALAETETSEPASGRTTASR